MDGHLHIICRLKRQWLIMDIISCQELIGDTEMRYGKGFIERIKEGWLIIDDILSNVYVTLEKIKYII